MIEGVDKSPIGHLDIGFERETRRRPCLKRSWCIEHNDHAGSCVEVPRATTTRPTFMPKGSTR